MPTEPIIKRMRLPAGLKRGDVYMRLDVSHARDKTYRNKKAVAILSATVYAIDGHNKRIEVAYIEKKFYARGAQYDKVSNATMQAISHVQKVALDVGVWLPLAARYVDGMGWNNLDQYFRSMFTDANVFVDKRARSNLYLSVECTGIRHRPKLGSYYVSKTGSRIYCLDPYCMQALILHDNAVLRCYADELESKKQSKKTLRKA